uniref:carboxypeptidase-like regulatory domain-containing protein n=1 Tax=Parabacteroides distasonis TaxID=823 RepID=UPI0040265ABB
MTKNESKLLSLQGIAKASAFCLLLSAFSVNAAMAIPASVGAVDEVMAVQQGKKVTGVVVDGTGEPVIGANVVVKGTTNGTITDFDGNYTIEGVSANDVLVVSYIGYLSQEIPVGSQSSIKVTLR